MKATCQRSGSCLAAMKLCVAVVVCVSALGYGPVRAEVCPGAKKECTLSDFTSKNCDQTSSQCNCVNNNYQPIPTGCAVKPEVRLESGRTSEFFPGSTVTLTCYTPDTKVAYSWKKNGIVVVNNTAAPQYVLPGTDDAAKVGSYSCATSEGPESQESAPVNITLVIATGPATPPIVSGIPASAAQDAQIDVTCTNIPYGATFQFQLSKNPVPTIPPPVTHDVNNGNITCVITNPLVIASANAKSIPTPWNTATVDNIAAVTTDPAVTTYFKPNTIVTVTCLTSPIAKYMLVGPTPKTLTYSIQDSANLAPVIVNNAYNVTPANGNHSITCGASYDNKTDVQSGAVLIVFDDKLGVVTPSLKASSNTVKLTTSLVLTCSALSQVEGVTYSWTKNNVPIPRQKDHIIQVNSFKDADAGKYVCIANKETFSVNSNTEEVKAAASGLHVLGTTLLVLVALASSKIF